MNKQFKGIATTVVGIGLIVFGAFSVANALGADDASVHVDVMNVETLVLGGVGLGSDVFGASGTRFPSGVSADGTSPSSGEVRGTTLTSTGAATLASASITGAATVGTTLDVSGTSDFLLNGTFGTTTATTTPQLFVAGDGVATSTAAIGSVDTDFCIQAYENGAVYKIYLNGTNLVVAAGICTE